MATIVNRSTVRVKLRGSGGGDCAHGHEQGKARRGDGNTGPGVARSRLYMHFQFGMFDSVHARGRGGGKAGRGMEQGYLLRKEGQSSSVNTVAIGEGDAALGRNGCGHDSQGVSVFSNPRGCLPNPKIGLALFKCANGNLPKTLAHEAHGT